MKKSLFLATIALVAFGCSESSDPAAVCGDGIVDVANGEQCEPAQTNLSCKSFDPSKKWKDGGNAACSSTCQLLVGTCIEDLPTGGTCGDGIRNEGEKCDKDQGVTCQDFDSTKKWKDGGKAVCSDDCQSLTQGTCVEDSGGDTPIEDSCGNGKLDDGEVCDKADTTPISCAQIDASKTWKDGGNAACADDCKSLSLGTCVEADPTPDPHPVCGDGVKTGSEVCDKADTTPIPCSTFDPSKNWKEGGNAACADDCLSFTQGSCEIGAVCGDGIVSGDEVCEKGQTITCIEFDNTKTWISGGNALCKDDCSGYVKNTCKEDTTPEGGCTTNDDCHDAGASICDTAAKRCVACLTSDDCSTTAKPICSENKVCIACKTDEDCGDGKMCITEIDRCGECRDNADCGDGQVCDNSKCTKDEPDETCAKVYAQGIYWCQIIDDRVTLDDKNASKSISAKFHIGSNVSLSDVKAEFVFQTNITDVFKDVSSWYNESAAITTSADKTQIASYTLTKAKLDKLLTPASGIDKIFYAFRLKVGDNGEWQYCERNSSTIDAAGTLKCDLKPDTIPQGKQEDNITNQHKVGIAGVLQNVDNIVAFFNFDKLTASTAESIEADQGTATLIAVGQGQKISINNSSRSSGGKEIRVNGWSKQVDILTKGIDIQNLALGNSPNTISYKVKRRNESSPISIRYSYSTDDGKTFVELSGDQGLLISDTKTYQDATKELPASVANKTITLRLTAYGNGNTNLAFDDITITKGN